MAGWPTIWGDGPSIEEKTLLEFRAMIQLAETDEGISFKPSSRSFSFSVYEETFWYNMVIFGFSRFR